MKKVAAGIVLYNPGKELLTENIEAVIDQVELLILVDNCSGNLKEIQDLVDVYEKRQKVCFIRNDKNEGIAKALNQIVDTAREQQCDWVLTLDQDSVCCDDLIRQYAEFSELPDAAMLVPVIHYRNHNNDMNYTEPYEVTKRSITSGSLLNIAAYEKIGRFTEKLFIDHVDTEYCARVYATGMKIYRINGVSLLQQWGDGKEVTLDGVRVTATNHNALRRYYISRNRVYCARFYPEYVGRKHTISFLYGTMRIIWHFEDDRYKKIWAMIRGSIAGLFMRK